MSTNRILIKKSKVTLSQPPLVIGRGAMGEVYLANFLGKPVVVKRSQREIDILLKEYSNYFKLQNHNNILKFFGVIREDRYTFSLVLEYAPNGSLSSYLKSHTVIWSEKARICRDIALGLMHCHENNVLHFDLKPENILLDQACVPKLADFGISKTKSQMVLDNGKAGGTLNYVAPERVCLELKMREFFDNHPKLSDIYSYGLILWSVAKDGEHPYEGMHDDEIREHKRKTQAIYYLLEQLPADTPQSFNQLIFDMTLYTLEYKDNLPVDDLDSSDEERDYSVSSSKPVSPSTTSTTIESTLASDKEITYTERSTEPRPLSISSSVYRYLKSLVTSPPTLYEDKNPMGAESPKLDDIDRNNRRYSESSNNKRDSVSSSHRRDSGVDRKSQSTLIGSPLIPKPPPFETNILKITDADQELMEGVFNICDYWEKFTDDVIKRKFENLCYDKNKKPKDLLTIFENYPSKSADYYFAYGFMKEHAFGKAKDPKMAFEYYAKAAELGDPRGLVFVGWCHYKGMGTPKDPNKAFLSFQRAANYGCVSAHNNVGWCYDIGFGTETDPYKAFEFFKEAADKGYATAQCRVGVCFEYGRGTVKSLDRALEWYTRAANNGHETAKRRVAELSKLIRRESSRRRSFLERVLYGPFRSSTT
ncbi:8937_t:CDS:2 [Funneliformis geosporum]|uniref:8937_t:CDS:1 n=1 Tax=Funneliformis geosporum TaxID=1117311 RepID=A0A9W4SCH2_9GLOM|nr:8937_t:CDS:2 [Funneliformis geosporum]